MYLYRKLLRCYVVMPEERTQLTYIPAYSETEKQNNCFLVTILELDPSFFIQQMK